jgi:hypothetical protein
MSIGLTATEHLKAKPIAAGAVVGVIASLCCGGSLIFASVGLGVFYSGLGLWRYIPQALAAGAVSIAGINYLFYHHMAKQGSGNPIALQHKMFFSAAIGLGVMAGSFIFLEWLNHAVINAERFLARPEYSQALIKGVPNVTLLCLRYFFRARVAVGAAISAPRFFEHSRCQLDETSHASCHPRSHDGARHRRCIGRDAFE